MKYLTLKKLKSLNPCVEGLRWFRAQEERDISKICYKLIEEGYAPWAFWLMSRLLPKKKNIKWAIYSAESVLKIYEDARPMDKSPREAIKAAKRVLKNPTKENKEGAQIACDVAWNAATSPGPPHHLTSPSTPRHLTSPGIVASYTAKAAYDGFSSTYTYIAANQAYHSVLYSSDIPYELFGPEVYAEAPTRTFMAQRRLARNLIRYALRLLNEKN